MTIRIDIPDDAWDDAGSEDAPTSSLHLAGGFVIAGLHMHLTAIAVHVVDGIQTALDDDDSEQFAELHNAFHGDGHFQTTNISGLDYALFAEPHC